MKKILYFLNRMTEENINEADREIRMALLEADVNMKYLMYLLRMLKKKH